MKNVYKTAALVLGLLLFAAQDVQGQRGRGNGQGNGQSNHADQVFQDDHFERGHDRRKGNQRYGHRRFGKMGHHDIYFGYGPGRYKIDGIYTFRGRVIRMRNGLFYMHRHGRWFSVDAPIGLQVDFIPRGANMVYTPRGVMHEFRDTFYMETRRGIFVVFPPHRRYGYGQGRGYNQDW